MSTRISRRDTLQGALAAPLGLIAFPSLVTAAAIEEHDVCESVIPVYLPRPLLEKLRTASEEFYKLKDYRYTTGTPKGVSQAKDAYKARSILQRGYFENKKTHWLWRPMIVELADSINNAIQLIRDLRVRPAANVRKDFQAALGKLEGSPKVDLAAAFNSRPLHVTLEKVTFTQFINNTKPPYSEAEPGPPLTIHSTKDVKIAINPCKTIRISTEERQALTRLSNIVQMDGNAEFEYRKMILVAESYLKEHDFDSAATTFNQIAPIERRFRQSSGKKHPLHSLAVCRCANVLILWADHLYRQGSSIDEIDQRAVRSKYKLAMEKLEGLGLPEGSFLYSFARSRIQAAKIQLANLDAGLNALGTTDQYVPVHAATELAENAAISLRQSSDALSQLRLHSERIRGIKDRNVELDLKRELMDLRRSSALLGYRIAQKNLSAIGIKMAAAEHQQEMSTLKAWHSMSMRAMSGVIKLGAKNPAGFFDLNPAGLLIDQAAQAGQHRFLMEQLKLNQSIAQLKVQGAAMDVQSVDLESQQLDRLIARSKESSLEYEYELAEFFYLRALRAAKNANRDLYQYERAIAARYLKPDLDIVRLDYLSDSVKGNGKHQDFGISEMTHDFGSLKKETSFATVNGHRKAVVVDLNFRKHFPEELKKLIETGETTFQLSLFALEHRIPGAYGMRIKAFAVSLVDAQNPGRIFVPRQQPYGELTHSGLFVDRNRNATIVDRDPEPRTEAGEAPNYTSVGVNQYSLPTETIHLSQDTQALIDTDRREGGEISQTPVLSSYGAAGLWKLKLKKGEHHRVGNILIQLRIGYFFDAVLERAVVKRQETFQREFTEFVRANSPENGG